MQMKITDNFYDIITHDKFISNEWYSIYCF